jgi:hypothetical protein
VEADDVPVNLGMDALEETLDTVDVAEEEREFIEDNQ